MTIMTVGLVVALLSALVSSSLAQDSWQQYIVGPQSAIVYPQAIVSFSGNVSNPQALIENQGETVITRSPGEDPPSVVLDFGINVVGFLQIAFNGASSNTPGLRLSFSETLQFLGDLSDYSRSNMYGTPIPITPGSDQIAVQASPYLWNATWGCQNGTQVCSDGLHGFRYMKIYLDALESDAPITSPTGTVNIASVSLKFSAFLATPDTFMGWFECSDVELNQFWYSGVYTNDLTTDIFRETDVDPRGAFNPGLDGKLVLHDGAKRDRDPYVGDVAVSGRTSYISHGNLSSAAARNVLADLANNQRQDGYIPSASVMNYSLQLFDYPLWWVFATNDYVLYTGDLTFLEEYFPNLERVFDQYYPANTNNTSNLISRPPGYGDFAFVPRDGEASYYNALYVLALKAAAECALWTGRNETATKWLSRANVVSEAINAAFWDDSVGAYSNSRTSLTSHPQDANAIAVLAGVAGSNRASSALGYLANATSRPYGNAFMDDDSVVDGGSQRVYAFMSTFDLRARFELKYADSALDEIRRLYGWMQTHDPNITFWEGVGTDGSMYQGGFTSAAHGWSTGIVGILTNYVLGLRFVSPGGLSFIFDPVPGDVKWAQGLVSTVNGPLNARWGDVDGTFTAELDVPEGVTGSAKIQVRSETVLVVHNEKEIWKNGECTAANVQGDGEKFIVISEIGAGKHVIKATQF